MHTWFSSCVCAWEEGACKLDYRFNLSKHMNSRISHSCRFAAWAHKVTHLRPGRRLCVPSECVFALRARGMSGQTDSYLRRRTALVLEMTNLTNPWYRRTQSFFRRPTAHGSEILTTKSWSRPLTPWSTMLTTSPWRKAGGNLVPRHFGPHRLLVPSRQRMAARWRKRQGRGIATGAHQRPLSGSGAHQGPLSGPGDLGRCASASGCMPPCLSLKFFRYSQF